MRQITRLVDDDRFAEAIDQVETDPQAATAAARNPQEYLRRQNVNIPPNLRIDRISRSNPTTVELYGRVGRGGVEFGVRVRF